ncbi:hypothetical protein VTN02DRAFT_5315 [Thermoascus thermophilus]
MIRAVTRGRACCCSLHGLRDAITPPLTSLDDPGLQYLNYNAVTILLVTSFFFSFGSGAVAAKGQRSPATADSGQPWAHLGASSADTLWAMKKARVASKQCPVCCTVLLFLCAHRLSVCVALSSKASGEPFGYISHLISDSDPGWRFLGIFSLLPCLLTSGCEKSCMEQSLGGSGPPCCCK